MRDFALLLIFLLIVCATIFDVGYHLIRGSVSRLKDSRLIALSSWVQYQSRICSMASVVVVTYLFESGISTIDVVRFMGISYGGGFFASLLYIRSRAFFRIVNVILMFPSRILFRNLDMQSNWYCMRVEFGSTYFFGFFLYMLFGFAVVAPFILANMYPELRMTFALSGQLLNFAGSIIAFSILEPRYFLRLDKEEDALISYSLVNSKVHAALLLGLLLVVF